MSRIFNRDIELAGSARIMKAGVEIVDAAGNITAPIEFTASDSIKDTSGNAIVAFSPTASAVNAVTITNAATGSGPSLSATGSDTNIAITVKGKGTGKVILGQATSTEVQLVSDQPITDSNGNELVKFSKASSAVNELQIANSATGNAPSIEATGGDTNINVMLRSKGTGIITLGAAGGGTGTTSSGAVTISTQTGVITTEALTTAAGSTFTITLTNTKISASSVILTSLNGGTNTAGTPIITSASRGSGSATIKIKNDHASDAFNGTLEVSFLVL